MSPRHLKIAAIPGDGIGKEVMPEGLRVLEAASRRFGFKLDVTPIEWASCDYYQAHGQMMPGDWKARLAGMDALYFGAAGLRPTSGQGTPSNRRAGRRLMYWSNSRRNLISEPHSDTWSGTVAGQPAAPKYSASWPDSRAFQSSGIIWPWAW